MRGEGRASFFERRHLESLMKRKEAKKGRMMGRKATRQGRGDQWDQEEEEEEEEEEG